MASLYEKTVEFVDAAFKGKQKAHLERAVFWYKKFWPEFTEAHAIAAYAHDLERAFREKDKQIPEDYLNKSFLEFHSNKGTEIISKFLNEQGAGDELINKVASLIQNHEIGGTPEQNALMDGDSVSYFETNAEKFVREVEKYGGAKKVKAKFDWMFNRIKSEEAKKVARPNYEKWISALQDKNKG